MKPSLRSMLKIPRQLTAFAAATLVGLAACPAHAQEPIRIGQSVVLSGPMAANGVLYTQGIRLHLDEINAKGGINGRALELITLDDGYDPERCRANIEQLLTRERVIALLGFAGTGATAACAPLAEAAQVPLLAPLTGAPELRDNIGRHLFFLRASYLDEFRHMAGHIKTIGIDHAAIVYQDDGFGRSALASAKTALEENGIRVSVETPIAAPDYDGNQAAEAVAKTPPQAIIMATAGNASVSLIRAYRKRDLPVQFFGLSVVSSDQLLRELGSDIDGVVISQVVPNPASRNLAVVRDFHRAAEAREGIDINHTSLEGYLAARILVAALKQAGAELTPEAVTRALEGLGRQDIGGFQVQYGPNRHGGSGYVDLSMLRASGQFRH